MRHTIAVFVLAYLAAPVGAVDFLGVELCADRVDTSVILPADSPLSLESAEVGRHGGLVLLLHSKKGKVLDEVDDLMFGFTGGSGEGDERKLEWASKEITAFAQVIKKGYVALAVKAAENCTVEAEAAADPIEEETAPVAEPALDPGLSEPAAAATASAAMAPDGESEPEEIEAFDEFELMGRLKHAVAEDDWVDVMGVVVNNSGAAYAVASFDLSLYDGAGELICVDTISVNHLREGQERAFRGAIRCADYVADDVAGWKLQFSGGH